MRVVIAGASGFVGRALCRKLVEDKYEVLALSRFRPGKGMAIPDVEMRAWNPGVPGSDWGSILEGAEAVINLCGENVAEGRWTPQRKEAILNSRIIPTRALVQEMAKRSKKPKTFISASAVGFYGPHGDGSIDESVGPGYGFLAGVCQRWEEEAVKAEKLGIRTVRLRTGVVLGSQGGALKKMLLPFKLGLGGRLGSGEQWMSWISLEDATGLIEFILKDRRCQGAVNLTAPHPVKNKEFTQALGKTLHRPVFLPVPEFVLKLMLGDMAQEMLLSGQRVTPRAATDWGYKFKHATLAQALKAVI